MECCEGDAVTIVSIIYRGLCVNAGKGEGESGLQPIGMNGYCGLCAVGSEMEVYFCRLYTNIMKATTCHPVSVPTLVPCTSALTLANRLTQEVYNG
jgi:hypothetical protein